MILKDGSVAMTGGLTVNADSITFGNGTIATLKSKTPSRTNSFLTVGGGVATPGDVNGTVIRLGAGGLTLVGGGEYVHNRYNVADLSDGAESLYLGADSGVYVETNGNTITSRKTFTFGTDGTFNSPSTIKQGGTAVSLSGHTHDAGDVSSGTLSADRIPSLNASKITAGTLGAARLPQCFTISSATSSKFSINGNANVNVNITPPTVSGYDMIAIVGFNTNHNYSLAFNKIARASLTKAECVV